MASKEKENIVSFISTLLVSIHYFVFIVNKYNESNLNTEEEIKFFATAILLVIPIRIAAQIIVYILFTIFRAILNGGELNEKDVVDERDTLIELKGDRNTTNTFTFGVMAAMLSVVAGGSIGLMFGIIVAGGFIGELIGMLSKFYYYNEGV